MRRNTSYSYINKERINLMDIHKSPVVSEPKRPFQENWMCPVCTYYNLPVIDKCDMCDTVRPGGDNPS